MVQKVVDILVRFRTNAKQFAGVMAMPQQQFRKLIDNNNKVDKTIAKQFTTMGRLGLGFRNLTHGARGFRMEMLGVMFFGMMVQKFFQSLIQPALQMTGAMELLSTVLGIMFLPIGLALIDFAISLLEWWNNLDEGTKKQIQTFVLLGLAIGSLLYVFGSFFLGIGSLILAFGSLLGPIGMVLIALAAYFLWKEKNEAILGTLSNLIDFVSKLWNKFLEWKPVKDALASLGIDVEYLKHPIKTIITWIQSMWDKFKESDFYKDIETNVDNIKKAFETFKKYIETDVIPTVERLLSVVKLLPDWFFTAVGLGIGSKLGPYGAVAGAAIGASVDIGRSVARKEAEQYAANYEINYSPVLNFQEGTLSYEELLNLIREQNERTLEEFDRDNRTRLTS